LNEDVLADHGVATVRAALRAEGKSKPAARAVARRGRALRARPAGKALPIGQHGVAAWPRCVVEYVRHYLSWATGGLYPRIQRVVREELMKLLGSFSPAAGN
jgi:hypothetical protein